MMEQPEQVKHANDVDIQLTGSTPYAYGAYTESADTDMDRNEEDADRNEEDADRNEEHALMMNVKPSTISQTETELTSNKELPDIFDLEKDMDVNSNCTLNGDGRGQWSNQCEFFLAIMGYTVGLGSVWRFPVICSRNGGGAFLIPFFFFLITSGGPLYYMEVCLGQFTGVSAGLAFEFCPLLKGLGMLQVIISLIVTWYWMLILAWILYFLYNSFSAQLPWATCDNAWNTDTCMSAVTELWSDGIGNTSYMDNNTSTVHSYALNNTTMNTFNLTSTKLQHTSPAFEFWEYQVVGRSRGLEDMGSIQIHLVVCLFLAWFFCVAAVIKGVQSLGKVVYVTATAPYVFMTIILIQGLTLDGAMEGINTYLTPDFSKLFTVQVWVDAAIQVFFSLGPCWGSVITMSSYNKFHQKTFWSTTMCIASAGFTAFYNGLVVFTLLGYMASTSGRTVQDVASESGPGLVFVVFPTALSQMPLPQLWSICFFLMLVTVAFDSLFGMFEAVTGTIVDFFPHRLISKRTTVNVVVGMVYFLSALPLTMNGGIYLFQLADWYFSTFALLVGSFLECIAVCWIYGTDRFANDINMMTGRDVCVILRVMWGCLIPVCIVIVFCTIVAQYSAPVLGNGYVYSDGANTFGFLVGMLPIVAMVLIGILPLYRKKGSILQRLRNGLKPSKQWIPHNRDAAEIYSMKPYTYPSSWWQTFWVNIRGNRDNPFF